MNRGIYTREPDPCDMHVIYTDLSGLRIVDQSRQSEKFSVAHLSHLGGFGEFFFSIFQRFYWEGVVSVKQRYLYIFGSKSFFRIHFSIFYSLLLVK